jgi:hypothetical protein
VGKRRLPRELPKPELKNEENIRFGFLVPHLGQVTSSSFSCILRKDSNFSPHCLHLYAYIGIPFSLKILFLLSLLVLSRTVCDFYRTPAPGYISPENGLKENRFT